MSINVYVSTQRYNRNYARFLIFLRRNGTINQRLYILYVRLATNLLQITEFTIKRAGKSKSIPRRTCTGTGSRYLTSHHVCAALQLQGRLDDAALSVWRMSCQTHWNRWKSTAHCYRVTCLSTAGRVYLPITRQKKNPSNCSMITPDLHRSHPDLDVQMVPVSVMFGRSPGVRRAKSTRLYACSTAFRNSSLFRLGRDSFVRFSPLVSLRRMATEHGTDKIIAQKLARVARMHFARQRLAAVGPAPACAGSV